MLRLAALVPVLCVTSLSASLFQQPPPTQSPKRDDVRAAAQRRVDALLEVMGGREAWRAMTAGYVDATHYDTSLREPHRNQIWNDFQQPRFRIHATSPEIDSLIVIDSARGWRRRAGQVRDLTADELTTQHRWWESNVYRTLHRLAAGDASIEARLIDANRIGIFRSDGTRLNWIRLNQRDEPIAFAAWDSEISGVWGPLATGGVIKHARWLANHDGTWRVELNQLRRLAPSELTSLFGKPGD